MLFALKYLAVAFIIIYVSTVMHELAHLLLCLLCKCRVVSFKIPFCMLYNNGKMRMEFSFNALSYCSFATGHKTKALWIVIVGPLTNLLIALALLVFSLHGRVHWGVLAGSVYNLVMFVYNLLPCVGGDGALIRKLFKER